MRTPEGRQALRGGILRRRTQVNQYAQGPRLHGSLRKFRSSAQSGFQSGGPIAVQAAKPCGNPLLTPLSASAHQGAETKNDEAWSPCISTVSHTLSHRTRAVWADGVKTGRRHSFASPHGDRAPVLMQSAQTASLDRSNGSLRRVGDVTQSPPRRSPFLSLSSSHWLKPASRAG